MTEIELGLFTTGLFGVLFHYVGQRDVEEERLRRIREVIAGDLAARPDGLVALVSAETRDRIVANCLRLQLGDDDVAGELYVGLREQLIRTPERRSGMDLSVVLAPWADGPPFGRGAMFVAIVRTEYQLTPQLQSCASCASPISPSTASPCTIRRAQWCITSSRSARWTEDPLPHSSSWSAPSTAAPRPARRAARTGAQVVTAHLGADAITATPLTICYTHRVLVQLHGHLLHLDIPRPTKGLTVQFSYGGCGIRYVNVLDYVASSRQPVLSRLPAAGPTPSIALRFDGWVMPKAGAAFVWVLEEEMAGVGHEVSERPASKTPH